MKNLVLIIALLVAPMVSFGQSVFDEFEDLDGVTSVVVNQKMFSLGLVFLKDVRIFFQDLAGKMDLVIEIYMCMNIAQRANPDLGLFASVPDRFGPTAEIVHLHHICHEARKIYPTGKFPFIGRFT